MTCGRGGAVLKKNLLLLLARYSAVDGLERSGMVHAARGDYALAADCSEGQLLTFGRSRIR
jgi:hypothetical protein